MKLFYIFLLAIISPNIFAQNSIAQDTIYNEENVDVKPDFVGGKEIFFKYIASKYKVPEEENLKGKIIVSFIIEKDGTLSDLKIIQDVGFGTGEQFLQLIKQNPNWKPGKKNGENVRVLYQIPLTLSSN